MEEIAVYRVYIETHFAAAHQLHGYKGLCRDLHGHTWKVRVGISTDRINDIGISFDFKDLKEITNKVLESLDHHYINDVPPFDKENPTAENLSRYIHDEIKKRIPKHVRMTDVTVWESDSYSVSYSENPSAEDQ